MDHKHRTNRPPTDHPKGRERMYGDETTYGERLEDFPYSRPVELKPRRPPKSAPASHLVKRFRICASALAAIERTIGTVPAETGGLLLGDPSTNTVTRFVFDSAAETGAAIYHPDVAFLNAEIDRAEKIGLYVLGIVHSHPKGIIHPSGPDLSAAYNNITGGGNDHLTTWLLPIVQTKAHGAFEFHPYVVSCSASGRPHLHYPQLEVIGVRASRVDKVGTPQPEVRPAAEFSDYRGEICSARAKPMTSETAPEQALFPRIDSKA